VFISSTAILAASPVSRTRHGFPISGDLVPCSGFPVESWFPAKSGFVVENVEMLGIIRTEIGGPKQL